MLNNTALQSLINTYGDRVYAFGLDNNGILYIGYKGGVQTSDISFETVDGVDFVKVKRTSKSQGSRELHYENWIVTDTIFWVGIMDENDQDYRPDPLILR